MRILLFFIDGVGLGADDPAVNPLVTAHMPALRSLLGGRPLTRSAVPYTEPGLCVVPTDPRMGVPGLPQSATGQTAIFTGKNGPAAIGRHLNGFPTPNLTAILNEHSVFKQVSDAGLSATFINAFRPSFFDWVAAGQPLHKDKHYRPSASTVAALAAGIHMFRTHDQLRRGEAVGADIDNHLWIKLGYDFELVDPRTAGHNAARIASQHGFTLYENFLTDKSGHANEDFAGAVATLELVDTFLGGLLEAMPDDLLLIITSDHGNIEDLSVGTHTANDVATILKGPGAEAAAGRIRALTDITPAIMDLLTGSRD